MSLAPTHVTSIDTVTVRPGRPLSGTVRVDGSKNAALPLLAAAAAVRRGVHLSGVPASTDVQRMLTLLERCGYRVTHPVAEPSAVVILPGSHAREPELTDAARIRASYYLVPPLLAAFGKAVLPWPGGCQIGDRGMEQHFKVYERFGDTVLFDDAGYQVIAGTTPSLVVLSLPFRSRGASIAAILRTVVAGCRLELGNPNLSPETTSVLAALRTAGWQAHASDEKITLAPPPDFPAGTVSWTVPGDKIEAGTLVCAIAATGGHGRIDGVNGSDLRALAGLLDWLGIPVTAATDAITVHQTQQVSGRPLRAIASLAPDGLDADFEPALIALALGLPGTHLFADSINPGRHGNLLPQLAQLGARIEELSPIQCRLTGPQRLTGAPVTATDIRTGSALLIAALTARGTTTVTGLDQLRRGHADLPAKLRTLGADITEVPR
ncbi:UDP-N-acetylglucosamine 1-carboxyvinyltransferase [Streptomyces sp. MBT56]|uniref:UDP-N-acetylglucosamine 1-carboxyvinyltransferase n=1 Tax=unclassified Streptomyces TaxID=2593676 RepID=UPI00190DE986|nr:MULTISPECIES: UDP-N-acetylglucosamine 1-carboxyvinyltransferase [unclassified Streptomyces]MBK3560302.1 UDP-N-acetylglucosamine 1-carboxyvinyltransferase [Streptomyces sp. MBT56]MBK3599968.1 UDP-N-acetylglucosamine 1-carboxyvinyltransferase [Streptomyces sp. MBT54]MBK3613222.1 UDP-N-acetylglucosamine 1-carboxyvinyltransferase [Streptomyces sp. MBT98]